jgi:glyoxylase-like metal-dependent hydrolase (beta-lactamase superfamily II)
VIHRAGTELVNWYLLEEDGKVTVVDAGCPGYRSQLEPALRAIHTPGHSPGHCVLHVAEEGALFTGDALCGWSTITGEPGPILPPREYNNSTAQARESLDRIEAIPVDTLYYGHGDPWTSGAAAAVARARSR